MGRAESIKNILSTAESGYTSKYFTEDMRSFFVSALYSDVKTFRELSAIDNAAQSNNYTDESCEHNDDNVCDPNADSACRVKNNHDTDNSCGMPVPINNNHNVDNICSHDVDNICNHNADNTAESNPINETNDHNIDNVCSQDSDNIHNHDSDNIRNHVAQTQQNNHIIDNTFNHHNDNNYSHVADNVWHKALESNTLNIVYQIKKSGLPCDTVLRACIFRRLKKVLPGDYPITFDGLKTYYPQILDEYPAEQIKESIGSIICGGNYKRNIESSALPPDMKALLLFILP